MAAAVPVGLMMLAMLARALGNVASKKAYASCGKYYNETMFYQHLLALPLIIGSSTHITQQVSIQDGGALERIYQMALTCFREYTGYQSLLS